MVWHTLAAFNEVERLSGVLLVVAHDDRWASDLFQDEAVAFAHVSVARCGGATRGASVLNGIKSLVAQGGTAHDWVLVHDAARCLVNASQINELIAACWHDDTGGLLALPLPDTLKSGIDGRVISTLERSGKWLAQTPQMFRLGALLNALEQAGTAVTDESSAMEAVGFHPKLVHGSAQNFKVTYPEDFALAEAVIQNRRLASSASNSTPQNNYDYP